MPESVLREPSARPLPETTVEERTWAAVAHVSALLTIPIAFLSAGVGAIPFVFIPLGIYLMYYRRSRFVAFHAAQALALQVIGSVGYFLFTLVGALLIALVTVLGALLTVILVGILVLLLVPVIAVAYAGLYVVVPIVFSVLGVVAAAETMSGRDYYYPYLGQWVESWLSRTTATPAPAV